MTGRSWLWPDRVIGKRESRVLREDHNALVNDCAELVAIARQALLMLDDMDDRGELYAADSDMRADLCAAIGKAERGEPVCTHADCRAPNHPHGCTPFWRAGEA